MMSGLKFVTIYKTKEYIKLEEYLS